VGDRLLHQPRAARTGGRVPARDGSGCRRRPETLESSWHHGRSPVASRKDSALPLRFVFALHDHQPVGNFDGVFESSYRDGYAPFLELIEQYPEIPVSLHTSGCLMEWLVDRHPEYVERLKRL